MTTCWFPSYHALNSARAKLRIFMRYSLGFFLASLPEQRVYRLGSTSQKNAKNKHVKNDFLEPI